MKFLKSAQIIVAAGQSQRMGGTEPKLYRQLSGKPLLRHTLEALIPFAQGAQIIVYRREHESYLDTLLAEFPYAVRKVSGGGSRSASVKAGLKALEDSAPDYVLIHDGARPFVSQALIQAVLNGLADAPASVPILPLTDSVKEFDGTLQMDVARNTLRRVQTPQAFHYSAIAPAFADLPETVDYADDISVAHELGMKITTVRGDENNFKVTYPHDFAKVEHMLAQNSYIALGHGYDVHRTTNGNSVYLCGIEVPAPFALQGHSDADIGLHALCDALFGALAEGDIGDHFPPSDAKWKRADSAQFLIYALERVRSRGGEVEHMDVTLICEMPKIKPYREHMRVRLADLSGLDIDRISVKATTSEKLGFIGRQEGLAAQATVTVRLPRS